MSGTSPQQPHEPQQYAQQPQHYAQQPQQYSPQGQQYASYPQQGYAAQPMYLMAPPPPRGKSIASMVIGLVSVFFGFVLVLPLIGFIIGLTALRSEPTGRGMAITGLILNGLMLLGWVVAVVVIVIAFLGLGAASYGTSVSV